MADPEVLKSNAAAIVSGLASQHASLADIDTFDAVVSPPLSVKEEQILQAYDRLLELELESALVIQSSEGDVDENLTPTAIKEQLKVAEREMLEAKATYSLRNNVVETVLMTDPTLNAVHAGTNASVAERRLLPHLQHRDLLSIAHTNISGSLSSTLAALTAIEAENVLVRKENVALAGTLLELAEEANSRVEDVRDPKLRAQIEELQKENVVGRSRWRTMKSITGAVVAGSGVDWARNDSLRELVADDEEASE